MSDLEEAIEIALDAYAGQEDKAGATYIRHPLRVMESLETETERIVAVLHDVVEDSEYTLDEVQDRFSTEVRDAVDALTRREEHGESYQEFVDRAAENPIARRVKIADIEDNMDLTRLETMTEDILNKQAEYHEAWLKLQEIEDAAISPSRS